MSRRIFQIVVVVGLMIGVIHGFVTAAAGTEKASWLDWLLNENWDRLCPWLEAHPPDPEVDSSQLAYGWYRCLERERRWEAAWKFLKHWLKERPRVDGQEELWVAYVDVTARMFQQTSKRFYWRIYRGLLGHHDRFVRYYAAFRLSYWPQAEFRAKALPVLREMLENEMDPNLLARAQLAWLRIRPGDVPHVAKERFNRLKAHILVEIHAKDGSENVRLRLPVDWAVWWLRHDDQLPIDEETRARIIERLQTELDKIRADKVLLEIREPDKDVIIRFIRQSTKLSHPRR